MQTDGPLVEGIGNAVDGVVTLLQIDAADGSAVDAPSRLEPDPLAGARPVERVEVLQPQRTLVHGEPAELVGVVVDRAGGARVPAERQKLEEIVAVDEIARIAPRREVQERLQGLGTDRQVVEQLADVAGLETGRRNSPERLDDAFDGDEHARILHAPTLYNALRPAAGGPRRAVPAKRAWDNVCTGPAASLPTRRR